MKKIALVSGFVLIILLIAFLLPRKSAQYHFSEFESIKTNFNDYQPSVADWIKGIRDNEGKWDFHLQKLVELGEVQRKEFVFTEIPYTKEASKQIWLAANSNFPNAFMFTGTYYDTNDSGYGVDPYVLKVWDVPTEMERWSSFFDANNRSQ